MSYASDTAARPPRTWLILGERAGDNAQVVDLGRALGWPGEVKQIRYDDNETVAFKQRGASLIGIDRHGNDSLTAPWPEAIIAIGRRSVPVARWIRQQARQAGSDVLHIHLGRPHADVNLFDLVVTTPQYNLPAAPNVMEISLPLDGGQIPGTAPAGPSGPEREVGAAPCWREFARFGRRGSPQKPKRDNIPTCQMRHA